MAHKFAQIAYTPNVRAVQEAMGSRRAYARQDEGPDHHDRLTEDEIGFIAARDSFYMATVGETGWPYIQHRGGPAGFVRVLDEKTIGFADFRGNRQYISAGNLAANDHVSLFFIDYPNQARLKLLGRARLVGVHDAPELMARLAAPEYGAHVERGFIIAVEAFDWNCSQHIAPRFTALEVREAVQPLQNRILSLESELEALRLKLTSS
ncbi:MAG: pyridoxamine 5'-phosphate oxidase family protein [Hyphomicrobiales bacterium]|nr:pyridoxamine 5'-phosphate oxidase family protein [Hyphomicrobiales bacterium]